MALLASSKLFWRSVFLVGNMADADGGYPADMGDSNWAFDNYTSIYLCQYTNDGKTYFGL